MSGPRIGVNVPRPEWADKDDEPTLEYINTIRREYGFKPVEGPMPENTPQPFAPTFNITIHIDTAPLAAALVALVDRFTKEDSK